MCKHLTPKEKYLLSENTQDTYTLIQRKQTQGKLHRIEKTTEKVSSVGVTPATKF